MTDAQEAYRAEYVAIGPQLNAVADDLKSWLAEACRLLVIYAPRIEARAKTPASYLTKIVRRGMEKRPFADPLREMTDKVGARADLIYARDVDRLVGHIRAAEVFEPISDSDVDDKRYHAENEIGYGGVHVDVTPRERHGLDRDVARCELQIRTNAQAAWAMASHELVYKPLVRLDEQERRIVNRLTVLMELFDEQVATAHDAMTGSEGYPLAMIIDALRTARFRFLGSEYDEFLTREIVSALAPVDDPDAAREFLGRLQSYVEAHEGALRTVVPGEIPALVSQPEALLVFMRLEEDPFALQQAWIQAGFEHSLLRDLASAIAIPLPDPL